MLPSMTQNFAAIGPWTSGFRIEKKELQQNIRPSRSYGSGRPNEAELCTDAHCTTMQGLEGPWSPKLTYTFYPFS